MARLPRKIDEIEHRRTGTKVALRWDKKTGLFQASYAGQTVTSEQSKDVKTKILALIETGHELTWEPVIELQVRSLTDRNDFYGDKTGGGVEVQYRRFYLSKADRLRNIPWEHFETMSAMRIFTPDGYHGRAVDFPCPYVRQRHTKLFMVFPYEEDIWKRLGDLAITLRKLGVYLGNCLKQDTEMEPGKLHSLTYITDHLEELSLLSYEEA